MANRHGAMTGEVVEHDIDRLRVAVRFTDLRQKAADRLLCRIEEKSVHGATADGVEPDDIRLLVRCIPSHR